MELTDDELALLTPEEREGLQEALNDADDNDDAAAAAAKAAQDASAANTDTDAGAADAAAAAQAAADAAAAAADDGGKPDAAEPAAPAKFQASDIPLIRPGQTENADARIAELETELDTLAEKFDNGDMTTAEFNKAQRAAMREINVIEQEKFRTSLSNETTQARAEQSWNTSVGNFLAGHPELGEPGSLRLQAYDLALRRVTGDEANQGKSDAELLELARTNWAKEFGVEVKPAPAEKDAKPAPAKSATDRPAAPNLATAPAASAQSTDDGRFANLDRLMEADPLAFEAELAKLTPSARDEYLKFAG